jgi:hypothetical protein
MQRDGVMGECAGGTMTAVDFTIENHEGESYEVKYLWGADFMVKGGSEFTELVNVTTE